MTSQAAVANNTTKTYRTQGAAIAAFKKAAGDEMLFVLSATPECRFYCVALPREDQVQKAVSLAYKGIHSVRV